MKYTLEQVSEIVYRVMRRHAILVKPWFQVFNVPVAGFTPVNTNAVYFGDLIFLFNQAADTVIDAHLPESFDFSSIPYRLSQSGAVAPEVFANVDTDKYNGFTLKTFQVHYTNGTDAQMDALRTAGYHVFFNDGWPVVYSAEGMYLRVQIGATVEYMKILEHELVNSFEPPTQVMKLDLTNAPTMAARIAGIGLSTSSTRLLTRNSTSNYGSTRVLQVATLFDLTLFSGTAGVDAALAAGYQFLVYKDPLHQDALETVDYQVGDVLDIHLGLQITVQGFDLLPEFSPANWYAMKADISSVTDFANWPTDRVTDFSYGSFCVFSSHTRIVNGVVPPADPSDSVQVLEGVLFQSLQNISALVPLRVIFCGYRIQL